MCADPLVGGAADKLERSDAEIGTRVWIRDGMRFVGEMHGQTKESEEDRLPESVTIDVAEECEVIDVAGLNQSHGSAQRVR